LYGGAGKRALCASEELAQNGRPAPLWFCGVPLLYGGAGKRALCAFAELAQNGRPAPFALDTDCSVRDGGNDKSLARGVIGRELFSYY
jgi:hypothetical protein